MLEKLSIKEVNCWEPLLIGEPHSEKPKVDSNIFLWKAHDFSVLWLFSNFADLDHFSSEALGPGRIMQPMRKFSILPQVLTYSDNKIPSLNVMCIELLLVTLKSPTSTTARTWGRISHWGYSTSCWKDGLPLPCSFTTKVAPTCQLSSSILMVFIADTSYLPLTVGMEVGSFWVV